MRSWVWWRVCDGCVVLNIANVLYVGHESRSISVCQEHCETRCST